MGSISFILVNSTQQYKREPTALTSSSRAIHLGCNNNDDPLNLNIDTMARQWKITGQEGWEKSLKYETDVRVPSAEELGEMQVLVKLHAASLNYRELMIPAVNVSCLDVGHRIAHR